MSVKMHMGISGISRVSALRMHRERGHRPGASRTQLTLGTQFFRAFRKGRCIEAELRGQSRFRCPRFRHRKHLPSLRHRARSASDRTDRRTAEGEALLLELPSLWEPFPREERFEERHALEEAKGACMEPKSVGSEPGGEDLRRRDVTVKKKTDSGRQQAPKPSVTRDFHPS